MQLVEVLTPQDLLALFANGQETFNPKYSTCASDTTFDLLGLVVSRATHMTLEQYVNATVLSRLGMKDSTFDAPQTMPHYRSQKALWGKQLGVSNP